MRRVVAILLQTSNFGPMSYVSIVVCGVVVVAGVVASGVVAAADGCEINDAIGGGIVVSIGVVVVRVVFMLSSSNGKMFFSCLCSIFVQPIFVQKQFRHELLADLLGHRGVARPGDRVVAVHAHRPRCDNRHRRLMLLHGAHLHRRRVRPQNAPGFDVERIVGMLAKGGVDSKRQLLHAGTKQPVRPKYCH